MPYRDPTTVVAPKSRWELGNVLCNTGQGGWSVAEGAWDKQPALAIRWNGDDDSSGPGNPQSHGNPTWFIVPEELEEAVRGVAFKLNEAINFVTCEISTPDGYQHGVFKVRVTLEGGLRKTVGKNDIVFSLPKLPNRFFRHEADYWVAPETVQGQWKGRIRNGDWEATVQTNGIPEDKNPTSMDVVRDALIANVVQSLAPWRPKNEASATSHHRLK